VPQTLPNGLKVVVTRTDKEAVITDRTMAVYFAVPPYPAYVTTDEIVQRCGLKHDRSAHYYLRQLRLKRMVFQIYPEDGYNKFWWSRARSNRGPDAE
jgi:hypothetical protein